MYMNLFCDIITYKCLYFSSILQHNEQQNLPSKLHKTYFTVTQNQVTSYPDEIFLMF